MVPDESGSRIVCHESILFLLRLGLSPVFPIFEVPSFRTGHRSNQNPQVIIYVFYEMIRVLLSDVFDTNIINYQLTHDWLPVVPT